MAFSTHPQVMIAALCDVDAPRMRQPAQKFPQARGYTDWRELLDQQADKIDAVSVSMPNHMHAPIAMSAIHRGKHVFVQKPAHRTAFDPGRSGAGVVGRARSTR